MLRQKFIVQVTTLPDCDDITRFDGMPIHRTFCYFKFFDLDPENLFSQITQDCGSESSWIRIHFAVLDTYPYWECGSGSRSIEIKN